MDIIYMIYFELVILLLYTYIAIGYLCDKPIASTVGLKILNFIIKTFEQSEKFENLNFLTDTIRTLFIRKYNFQTKNPRLDY